MTPKFSIIVPVYNVASYLRECLDSVLSQTCCDWECICVDDGSTDGCGEILDEYSAGDRRFIVVHQKNGGVAAARNAAMEIANGEWILFVDADDLIGTRLLEYCLRGLKHHVDVDLLWFGMQRFELKPPECVGDADALEALDISRHLPYQVDNNSFWQFAYRADLICGRRFPPYVMGEDRLFMTWMLTRARKVFKLCIDGYFYRCHSGSAVGGRDSWRKRRDDILHLVRRLFALLFSKKRVEWRIYRHLLGLLSYGQCVRISRLPFTRH